MSDQSKVHEESEQRASDVGKLGTSDNERASQFSERASRRLSERAGGRASGRAGERASKLMAHGLRSVLGFPSS